MHHHAHAIFHHKAVKRLQRYGDLTVVQMMTFISTNCYVFVHYGSGIFNSTEID